MKIIYEVDGSPELKDDKATCVPQHQVRIRGVLLNVINTISLCDVPEETYIVQCEMPKEAIPTGTPVKVCRKVWAQNAESLTVGKEYPVLFQEEECFIIKDDKGREKRYLNDNKQFYH